MIVLVLGLGLAGRAAYRWFASDLPPLDSVGSYGDQAPGVTRIYAADGALLAELAREHRSYAALADIPEPLVAAFLAAEDRRFLTHGGLDYRGLARAMWANLRSGTVVQGGSTITQQVAKSFLVDQERTVDRKLREAILAVRMESRLGKATILEIYLNKIFLGHGAYGVRAAASRYFDKSLDELTLAECALIAGLAQAPSRWSPVVDPKAALRRRAQVLGDMVEFGYIDAAQAEQADAQPIVLAELRDPFRFRAPFYAEQVRQVVAEQLGEDAVVTEGLVIESAVQLPVQAAADHAVDVAVRKLDRRQGWRGPETHLPDEPSRVRLRERMQVEYGGDPLAWNPKSWRLGLVESVDRYAAEVSLGAARGKIQLRHDDWASPYDGASGTNDVKATSLTSALEVGDVIWVRPRFEKPARPSRPASGPVDPHAVEPEPEPIEPGEPAPLLAEDGMRVLELGQTPQVEAALYVYDHRTGYVPAFVGGDDYDRSQFDRTTKACRQPGSVFKAFYYALALEQGKQMDTVLEAKPWEPEPGEEWNPRNIDKTVDGKVLLRTAFIKSLNTPSIRLFLSVGIEPVVEFSRKLGFTTELIADKGLSLGASCVRIDELTRAFGVFARGGSKRDPSYVRRIVDKQGVLRVDNRHPYDAALDVAGRIDRMAALVGAPPAQLIDPRTNFLISRLMREVVTAGTSTKASHIPAPAAGKSGTASGRYRRGEKWADLTTDTWFVGYTSREAASAWMGFDDRNERSLGDLDASYTTAVPMWTDFMRELVAGHVYEKIPQHKPAGIGTKIIDATAGGPPIAGMPTAQIFYREDLRHESAPAESPSAPID
ncbi:penicillin-binding protein 1A [Nannocystaceae bacterium ST9]